MIGRGISVAVAVGGGDVWVAVASGNGVAVSGGVVGDAVAVGEGIGFENWHPLKRSRAANPHKILFFTRGTLFLWDPRSRVFLRSRCAHARFHCTPFGR